MAAGAATDDDEWHERGRMGDRRGRWGNRRRKEGRIALRGEGEAGGVSEG